MTPEHPLTPLLRELCPLRYWTAKEGTRALDEVELYQLASRLSARGVGFIGPLVEALQNLVEDGHDHFYCGRRPCRTCDAARAVLRSLQGGTMKPCPVCGGHNGTHAATCSRAAGQVELSFSELRDANVRRCEEVFHKLDAWPPDKWTNALAGEVGEACNITKKMGRGDYTDDHAMMDAVAELAKELADVVIYADLTAARVGIDLGRAVREKFNEVSQRRSASVHL